MRHFQTVLLLSLAAFGCGGATEGHSPEASPVVDGGRVGDQVPEVQRRNVSSGGSAGSEAVGIGGTDDAGSAGAGDIVGLDGSADAGGSAGASQGGSAGDGGSAGQAQGGAGGSENQGGTGGSASEPAPPACTFDLEHGGPGTRCTGLLFETCTLVGDVAQYSSSQCGLEADVGLNCDPDGACFGECTNGDVRCTGETAEACVSGAWTATEECGFQCVNGACEGACTPGDVVCDGASRVTCGGDFHYGSPVACSDGVNATATCSGAGVCGTTCAPGFDDCNAADGCETDLSSPDSCGLCGFVCPGAANATRTCNGGVCGLTPIPCSPGTANCTGDFVCETPTTNDPLNCGGCGVSCYGGTCNNGTCSDSFEVVGDFSNGVLNDWQTHVVDMAVGASHVYWWTHNQGLNVILRAPKSGGVSQTLTTFSAAEGPMKDNVLLVDGGLLYWATGDGIYRMPEAGGAPVRVSTLVASSLAISAGKLYWNDSHVLGFANLCGATPNQTAAQILNCNANKVVTFYTLDLSTLALTQWTTNQYEYGPVLGVVDSEVFVTRFVFIGPANTEYAGSVRSLDAATGAASRIIADSVDVSGTARGLTSEFGQAVFAGNTLVYTAALQATGVAVCTAPLDQGSPSPGTRISGHSSTAGYPEYLAADSTHAYLASDSVESISFGGTKTTVFNNPGALSSIAVDGSYVYWSVNVLSTGEKAILRVAK